MTGRIWQGERCKNTKTTGLCCFVGKDHIEERSLHVQRSQNKEEKQKMFILIFSAHPFQEMYKGVSMGNKLCYNEASSNKGVSL